MTARIKNVRISPGFWLGNHEVTQAEWQGVTGTNPPEFSGCGQCPVETVSWNDARAGTTGDRYGNLDAIAWCSANSGEPPARMIRSWNSIALLAPLASIRILYGLILVSYELDRVSAALLRAVGRSVRSVVRTFQSKEKYRSRAMPAVRSRFWPACLTSCLLQRRIHPPVLRSTARSSRRARSGASLAPDQARSGSSTYCHRAPWCGSRKYASGALRARALL